jgi:hypothetical protein
MNLNTIALPWKARPTTTGVSHCGLAIYIKTYLRAKEELWKIFKIFSPCKKKKIFKKKKKSSKRNQNPSRY